MNTIAITSVPRRFSLLVHFIAGVRLSILLFLFILIAGVKKEKETRIFCLLPFVITSFLSTFFLFTSNTPPLPRCLPLQSLPLPSSLKRSLFFFSSFSSTFSLLHFFSSLFTFLFPFSNRLHVEIIFSSYLMCHCD